MHGGTTEAHVPTTHAPPAGGAERASDPDARSQLLVGPEDGYGPIHLTRLTVHARAQPRREAQGDQLIIVLDGYCRVSVEDREPVTLAPDEMIHVPHACDHVIDVLETGSGRPLQLLVLSTPR